MSLIRSIMSGDVFTVVILVAARAFVVFCCLPIHELAHGWMAYKLGDNTAKNMGRLSFNPIAHLDPIGTIMIFLFGIGYARPVPINPLKFKDYRKGVALTALAGPLSNLIMSFIFAFLSAGVSYITLKTYSTSVIFKAFTLFFSFAASVNISLAVFNLLPIPPLDGSRILGAILPDRLYEKYFRYERIIMIVLIVLLFTGVLDGVLSVLVSFFYQIITFIPNLIFGF